MNLQALGQTLRRWAWPQTCLHCREDLRPAEEDDYLCALCLKRLLPSTPPYCPRCAAPIAPHRLACRSCASGTRSCALIRAAFLYRGPAVSLVHAVKFLGRRRATAAAGRWMSRRLPAFPELRGFDAVVCVPLHPGRQRERGYNQARILAERVAAAAERPLLDLLIRRKPTAPQWRLNSRERKNNLKGAFVAMPEAAGQSLLLVDDVCTTGTTLEECAKALLGAGAARVRAFVFARD